MDSPKQPVESTSPQRIEDAVTQRNPAWFTGRHLSAWDRVREAFRRDWEQTKADFSTGHGRDLKQSAGDTLTQALGTARPPAASAKTHVPSAKDLSKAEERMLDQGKKTAAELAKAQEEIDRERAKLAESARATAEKLATQEAEADRELAKQRAKLDQELATQRAFANEKIANAARKAEAHIDQAHEKMDAAIIKSDEATEAWAQTEREARYGFSARSQYPQFAEWTPALVATLRGEWTDLETGRSWEEAMPGIRRGWEFAKPQTH